MDGLSLSQLAAWPSNQRPKNLQWLAISRTPSIISLLRFLIHSTSSLIHRLSSSPGKRSLFLFSLALKKGTNGARSRRFRVSLVRRRSPVDSTRRPPLLFSSVCLPRSCRPPVPALFRAFTTQHNRAQDSAPRGSPPAEHTPLHTPDTPWTRTRRSRGRGRVVSLVERAAREARRVANDETTKKERSGARAARRSADSLAGEGVCTF